MVALRQDLDALGRTADERRLILLRSNADRRMVQSAAASAAGAPDRALGNGRLAMLQLAERADIFVRQAEARLRCLACEENDQTCALHAVHCPCRRPWGCSDRCLCFGAGMRGSFFVNVECLCWDHDEADEADDEGDL